MCVNGEDHTPSPDLQRTTSVAYQAAQGGTATEALVPCRCVAPIPEPPSTRFHLPVDGGAQAGKLTSWAEHDHHQGPAIGHSSTISGGDTRDSGITPGRTGYQRGRFEMAVERSGEKGRRIKGEEGGEAGESETGAPSQHSSIIEVDSCFVEPCH